MTLSTLQVISRRFTCFNFKASIIYQLTPNRQYEVPTSNWQAIQLCPRWTIKTINICSLNGLGRFINNFRGDFQSPLSFLGNNEYFDIRLHSIDLQSFVSQDKGRGPGTPVDVQPILEVNDHLRRPNCYNMSQTKTLKLNEPLQMYDFKFLICRAHYYSFNEEIKYLPVPRAKMYCDYKCTHYCTKEFD